MTPDLRALADVIDEVYDLDGMIITTAVICDLRSAADQLDAQQAVTEAGQEPVAEVVCEDMGKPFNAMRVRLHFYKEIPPIGTKLFLAPSLTIRQEERERCAKLAEDMRPTGGRAWSEGQAACFLALSDLAAAIREEKKG